MPIESTAALVCAVGRAFAFGPYKVTLEATVERVLTTSGRVGWRVAQRIDGIEVYTAQIFASRAKALRFARGAP